MSKLDFLKKMNRNALLVGIAIIAIVITGVLILAGPNAKFSFAGLLGSADQKIAKQAVDYINSNGLTNPTSPATLGKVSEESGLIKIQIKIGTNTFDSYITKDGKFLFPQAIDISKAKTTAQANGTPQTATDVKKTDKPMLEAYVVARCPYGLQMQRAMADAVNSVPALAQYIKVRYIGSVSGNKLVSMHGDAEATENLRQICIRDEQSSKYWSYVACQMKTGDTAGCEKSTGIDSAKLNSCVSTASKGLAYAQQDFNLDSKYNVQGSPTLILNGVQIDESSFGGRSSDGVKSMVCAAFNSKPSFCSQKLNTTEAATSFSTTYAGSDSSANSGANCAPAQ